VKSGTFRTYWCFLFIFKKEKRVGLGGPKKKKSDYIIHYSMNIAPKKVLVN